MAPQPSGCGHEVAAAFGMLMGVIALLTYMLRRCEAHREELLRRKPPRQRKPKPKEDR